MRQRMTAWLMGLALALAAGCIVVQREPVVVQSAPVEVERGPVEAEPAPPDVSIFYDSLAPYGQWVTVEPYGLCWVPDGMDADWRPYTRGDWEYTDYGWVWISDYPWGWACFHYGRWFWHDAWGWCWVPGHVWAPAWCAWRSDAEWFGWCALPPSPAFLRGVEFEVSDVDWDDTRLWRGWCFVPRRDFYDVDLHLRIAVLARNVTLLRTTRHVRGIRLVGGRARNDCFTREEVEHAIGRRVRHLRMADARAPGRDRRPRIEGDRLFAFRPPISPDRPRRLPPMRAPQPDGGPLQRMRRQAAERGGVEGRLSSERSRLDRFQQDERERRHAGEELDRVLREQREERRAFEEHERAARELIEERHRREWQGPGERGGRVGPPERGDGERGSQAERDGGRRSERGRGSEAGRRPENGRMGPPQRGDAGREPEAEPDEGRRSDRGRGSQAGSRPESGRRSEGGRVGPPGRGDGRRGPAAGRGDEGRGPGAGPVGGGGSPGGRSRDTGGGRGPEAGRGAQDGSGPDTAVPDDEGSPGGARGRGR